MAKKPKDDGTRSGRMEGPRLPIRKDFPFNLAEGGMTPTGRNKTLPQFIDFETRSEVPLVPSIREQVIEAAMMKFPGRTLEEVTLPNNEGYALRPYQQEMLRSVMEMTPEFETPAEGDIYKDFVDRYAKGDTTAAERRVGFSPHMGKPYGGKMRDYMRQHTYFASGSADFMRKADAMRRFYVLGGGEGNRQLAYYAYGMALSQTADNWVDDVYDRKQRRAEAKLREYCMADVLIFGDYAAIERRIMFTLLDGYPTVDVTHRLTGPYGWASGQGTGILIEYMSGSDDHPWPTQREADMISGIFVSFGCAPVYAQKAADSLFGCGQYSCIVTVSKLALRNLGFAMEAVGCALTITQHPGAYPEDSNKDIR